MLLIIVNYPNEIDTEILKNQKNFDIKFLNESKGFLFGMKLLKILVENKNKYDLVLHFGLCGGKDENQIGKIYKIDRTFLFDNDIIENQRFKNGNYKFKNIENNNIISKFRISKNPDKIYDFADIYDLETFWVANISNQVGIPIFSIKGVSDLNDIFGDNNNENNEINFLLEPGNKRNKKILYLEKLNKNINLVNLNLKEFLDLEFMDFYERFNKDKDFKKSFYV